MSDDYVQGRGLWSSVRLNLQHFLWERVLGYNLHPSISTSAEDLMIADVGTGTGIWLSDLASSLPSSTQLHGYDISPQQYPKPSSLPKNVSLHVLDASQEPPAHLREKYDIVHIRLFLSMVQDEDPSPFLKHCLALLKPGGYIQWDEHDPYRQEVVNAPGSSAPNLAAMAYNVKTVLPRKWVARLPKTFAEYGLQTITVDARREHEWQRKIFMETWCTLFEEMSLKAKVRFGECKEGEEFGQWSQGAHKEIAEGSYVSQIFHIVVGRKPL